jgi:hypothetical protein
LQNYQGGRRRGCGGATWRAAVGCADAMLTQADVMLTPAVDRARGPGGGRGLRGSRWTGAKGVTPDLIWTVGHRSIGRGGPRAAGGGARPEMAAGRRSITGVRSISSYRAPFRVRFGPGGREGWRGAHQGLGAEGNTAEKEIGAARRSSGGSSGAAALHTREREADW